MPTTPSPPSSKKQILIGALVVGAVGLFIMLISLGRFIPGTVGEFFGVVSGIFSSPFLMEGSLAGLGLLTVLLLNYFRQRREGDELVYLEQITGPEAAGLPDQARWAAYEGKPLKGENPCMVDLLEGAVSADDFEEAAAILSHMTEPQLASADVLRLRVILAQKTGRTDLVARLEKLLDSSRQEP